MGQRVLVNKNFCLDEFLPKQLYKDNEMTPWKLQLCIDIRIVTVAQALRDRFGELTINNWYHGGDREWSGLRIPGSPYYSKFSQHSFGRAIDVISTKVTAEEMRNDIRKNYNFYKHLGVTRIESGTSWLHVDLGYSVLGSLMEVKP